MTDLLVVVGTRRDAAKTASVVAAARARDLVCLVVSAASRHHEMLRACFRELGVDGPDLRLDVCGEPESARTGSPLVALESALGRHPHAVVVGAGDGEASVAAATAAGRLGHAYAQIEAGLRSGARDDVRRRLCDHAAGQLFTSTRAAADNLLREGLPPDRIHFVGSTLVDAVLHVRWNAVASQVAEGVVGGEDYCILAVSRPATVDDPEALHRVLEAAVILSRCIPLVLPLHPRTRDRMAEYGLDRLLAREPALIACEPLAYSAFVSAVYGARLVLTDSGEIEEEAAALGAPVVVLREESERLPVATRRLAATDTELIVEEALSALEQPPRPAAVPELWDGRAGNRIVELLATSRDRDLPLEAVSNLELSAS